MTLGMTEIKKPCNESLIRSVPRKTWPDVVFVRGTDFRENTRHELVSIIGDTEDNGLNGLERATYVKEHMECRIGGDWQVAHGYDQYITVSNRAILSYRGYFTYGNMMWYVWRSA